ncbi:MAG: SWIM zinc finger family protein [Streptosporangiales bacterium]
MSNWFPPPSRPRPVDGGITTRSKRGAIAQTWWSERFIAVLESIGLGNRLTRGRSYARAGQVVDLRVEPGAVTAMVQGSRVRPYRIRVGLTAFGKAEWAEVEQALTDNAWYAAKLLAGEMPEDIEGVFSSVGLSLFPASPRELSMDCSCPDSQVPCKHLAAVYYLLAESFDADPFAILAWRGRGRDDLLDNLRAKRSGGLPAADRAERVESALPLTECLDSYFLPQGEYPALAPPQTRCDTLLDQLPPVQLSVRGRNLVELLRPAYLAMGEPQD